MWLFGLVVTGAALGIMGCQQKMESARPESSLREPSTSGQDAGEEGAPDARLGVDREQPSASSEDSGDENATTSLPRLVDLGAGKCIPCKLMAPILAELKEEYQGVFDVEFIDVWENKAPALEYGIETIPTQIFFDASGKERFRHEGFFGREEILSKWRELGVEVDKKDA